MEELGRGTCVRLPGAPAVLAGRGGVQGQPRDEERRRGGQAGAQRAEEWRPRERSEAQEQVLQGEQ